MTPAARASAAISVLDGWLGGLAAEQALSRWSRGARYAGSGDRAAVRDLVFDVLRHMESAAQAGGAADGRGLVLGLLRLRGSDPASLFDGVGYGPEPLTEAETAFAERPLRPPEPGTDIPPWLREAIGLRAEDAAARDTLFAALCERAPVWLRVVLRRTTRDAAQARLDAEGIATRPDPGCDTALLVTGGARSLRGSAAYRDGLVELQDLSAQRAVASVPWPSRGRILDFCAGGGGKALAITDRTGAAVLAHDASERRMSDLPARAARAGVTIERLASGQAAARAPYEAVLCDVPCSGTGTWRRDPEAKWRLAPERLDELRQLQAHILDEAAPLVAEGGLLVYMTCSLLACEDEEQVAAFLRRAPGWRQEGARLDTPLSASDGFYTAILRRTA
ncbi:RsmB/NOP family class I SAM-dependent RNA methyltransferase [Roseibacterium sp. SDUM158017]|uniref:RsmB/NOP family class I SAM-dependent RNA methyltransferase n=1 Tax=Roseicyclus salinarum TaxID=3036773 RepID=UPI00241529F3|nr:RsmB/NOP family class I SAM-dependent RNA methyltransferase [Roseibacterium sp. SDUM158017]MDG4648751.1 RsmB/NOP family class I SAM-dependent RNA methyltransferase [Roseibacterium sp. SDUM158017]